MYTMVLVSSRMGDLVKFTEALSRKSGIVLSVVETADEMLRLVRDDSPDLVILDEELKDVNPLSLVITILSINAMVNTAMITSMDAEVWHEKSEGLGMLPPLANPPTAADADILVKGLQGVVGTG